IKDLAPAIVTDYNVGNVPVTVEPAADFRYCQTVRDTGLQLAEIGIYIGVRRYWAIFELADAFDFSRARLSDEAHVVPVLGQISCNVNILAGKVLVDEKKLHQAVMVRALQAVAHRSKDVPVRSLTSMKPASISALCKVRAVKPVRCAI